MIACRLNRIRTGACAAIVARRGEMVAPRSWPTALEVFWNSTLGMVSRSAGGWWVKTVRRPDISGLFQRPNVGNVHGVVTAMMAAELIGPA